MPSLKLAVPRERRDGETRVACVPAIARRFVEAGVRITIESGAGVAAGFPDSDFTEAGAQVAADPAETMAEAGAVLKVRRPTEEEVGTMPEGARLFCLMSPHRDRALIERCARQQIDAFALELMPRVTRAQSMDVLSSQSNLAGYRSVIEAVSIYGRIMPMMMTAAGTIAPARVFVMGAGVAGLQAIATARRLGAVVSATDVRPAAKEQVASLGADFIAIEDDEFRAAETAGGYAREMSAAYREKQAALVARHITRQDIVITTALVPGKRAPVLLDEDAVRSMHPGAVIVDMAVEEGGNCALSEPGEIVDVEGVRVIGFANLPGRVAGDASSLYARNLFNFIATMLDEEGAGLTPDTGDELVRGTLLTCGGRIVHPDFAPVESVPANGGNQT